MATLPERPTPEAGNQPACDGITEYLLRVPGGLPCGAVRTTREEILDDLKYVEARWGKREAVQRTVSPWIEVQP